MASHIRISPIDAPVTISAGGRVLGASTRALELQEGSYPAVVYVPRADIDMALLERTDRASTCPWKGKASYYSVLGGPEPLVNAVWSYEAPLPDMAEIAGHLAFYTDRITVTRG